MSFVVEGLRAGAARVFVDAFQSELATIIERERDANTLPAALENTVSLEVDNFRFSDTKPAASAGRELAQEIWREMRE